ncbi:MAG: mitochondrial thiamine pyrophosphate transporter [Thelocarpon superellum]|nr:MAG: mitochondrial thiamine pyrophosphate transporter [Thelocarpon superellum]
MTDPDAMTPEHVKLFEFCHWIATNVSLVPTAIASPAEVESYYPPGPPPKTGPHRYVFVLLRPRRGHGSKDLTKPESRYHWGFSKPGQGLRLWANENDLEPVGNEHLKDEGSRQQTVIAGATAGLISRFCVAPLDVVKIRLQLQVHSLSDPLTHRHVRGPIYKGTLPTLRAILQHEGVTGLWKGNVPAEMLYVLYGGVQFSVYRSTTMFFQSNPMIPRLPDAAESFASGAVAGGVATTATYPLDLLRTRFAAQGTEKIYTSLLSSIRDIYRQEGWRGYFQGLGAGVGQIVPYMGLFFATYESIRVPIATLPLAYGSSDAMAGVLASVISKTGVFPLDLVRKRLQVQGPTRAKYIHRNIPKYRGVLHTLSTIVRQEGWRGLYRGLTVSLFKAAPASAVTMWTYENVLKLLIDRNPAGG